jgi:hypothetical protein
MPPQASQAFAWCGAIVLGQSAFGKARNTKLLAVEAGEFGIQSAFGSLGQEARTPTMLCARFQKWHAM